MKWKELIKDCAWVAEDMLTREECEYFLKRASELDIQSKKAAGDIRHRDSISVKFNDEDFARTLFERIKGHIPQEVWVDEQCDNLGLQYSKNLLYGKWTPYALNFRLQVACYPGKGHFGPHRDGPYVIDEHHRSLVTINSFLTDRPLGFGGATRFVKDDIVADINEDGIFSTPECDVLHRVDAERAGTASIFFHDLMHDGEPLKEGSPPKWIFRTEVMYERDPTTAPQLSQAQKEAREYLSRAEVAETNGDIAGATKFYKMAYKLDPVLDGN